MDFQASNPQAATYLTSAARLEVILFGLKFGPWLWKGSARFLDRHGLDNEILHSLFFLIVTILCKEIIVFISALDPKHGDAEVRNWLFWNRIKKGCCMCVSGVLATAVTLYLRRAGIPYSDIYLYPFFVPVSTYKMFFQLLFPNYVFHSPTPSSMGVHDIRYDYAMRLVAPLAYLEIFNYITYTSDLYLRSGFKERAVAPGFYVVNFIFVMINFAKDAISILAADEKAADEAYIEPSPQPSSHNISVTNLSTEEKKTV